MNKTNILVDLGSFTAFLIAMTPALTGVTVDEWLSPVLVEQTAR